jgi:cytochrome c oxidase assembly protein subunit 15
MFGLAVGIAAQGALGWYMVKSGLDQEIIDTNSVPRVSQYRLAAHLSAALALYIGMVQTAISLRSDAKYKEAAKKNLAGVVDKIERLSQGPLRKYKTLVRVATLMVFFTAASGAFVAGLDAGLVYNEFPTMGGKLMPDTEELMDWRFAKAADRSDLWWRNLLENPVTVQWDHRVFVSLDLISS